eukprot:322918_1
MMASPTHLFVIYVLITIWLLMTKTSSQTTICVWNSIDDWDHLNGEYTLQSGTHNGYSFWKQVSTAGSCPETPYYIFEQSSSSGKRYWIIHDSLSSSNTFTGKPLCADMYDGYTFPNNPTQCRQPYSDWIDDFRSILLPLTVTSGSCPSLPCNSIQITNTGDSQCDTTFFADITKHNFFVSTDNIYFFFHQYIFKWICSDTISDWTDCDGYVDVSIVAKNDGWQDVSVGSPITILFDNGNYITLECSTTTSTPTSIPTLLTLHPSQIPSAVPTLLPLHPSSVSSQITVGPSPTIPQTTTFDSSSRGSTTSYYASASPTVHESSTEWMIVSLPGVIICVLGFCVSCVIFKWKKQQAMKVVDKVRSLSMANNIAESDVGDFMEMYAPNNDEEPPLERVFATHQNDKEDSFEVIGDDETPMDTKDSVQFDVASWLESVIGLAEYYPLFIQNGFETIRSMQSIKNISQLKELGIQSTEHQQRIMSGIQLLSDKSNENVNLNEDVRQGEIAHGDDVKVACSLYSVRSYSGNVINVLGNSDLNTSVVQPESLSGQTIGSYISSLN